MRRWWWLFLIVFIMVPSQGVLAAGAGFTVTPELPANQLGGNTGWFNLLVKPGQKQDLTVEVANQSGQEKRLTLALTDAFTQDNGQVGYDPDHHNELAEKHHLTAMGSKPITIELAAHQGQRVTFQVTVPAAGFEGQVLGAVYVRDLTEPAAGSSSGLAVTNQFAMVVAIQLQTSEQLVPPLVHLLSVKANGNALAAVIQNAAPRLFGKLKLQAKVIPAGKVTPVYQKTNTDYAMAPSSAFHYQLTPPKGLAAGRYRVVIDATAGTYKWHLTKSLTLKTPLAADTPAPPAVQKANRHWWPWVLALVGGVTFGILIGWWRGRQPREG